jgi:hypothetical protein
MPPPAPRRFPLRAIDPPARLLLLFGAIWMVVQSFTVAIFIVVGGPFWDDILLDRRGVTVRATLGMIEPTRTRVNGRQAHCVYYTFTDASGVTHAGSGATLEPAAFYSSSDLEIDYDPKSPARSRLHGGRASSIGLGILWPLVFFAAGAIVLGFGVRRVRAMRAIYVHGQPARAVVTAVTPTLMQMNGRRVMRIAYTFDTIMGPFTGSATAVKAPAVGDTLWVLHLPSEPKRNVAA